MKKLDILIVKAFVGPFVATFFITVLVLVMQFFWLYIDDFVGKGLGPGLIFEFIWYQSAALVPLALPLSILLSSLMTFGNLGESFELVAIKASGISLLRFMRPLFVLSIFISFIAFLFANYVIPVANLKSRTLLTDIVKAKPAFDLREGVFYDRINGYAIKIGKKEANDSVIRDIIVYEQNNPTQDNFIIAKSGIMRVSANKRFLEFNLKDGWRYQEKGNQYEGAQTDYVRLGFKDYQKDFDLSDFQFNRSADSNNKNNERMYSMRQLNVAIDSLQKENGRYQRQMRGNEWGSLQFVQYADSFTSKKAALLKDTAKKIYRSFDEMIPDSARQIVQQRALGQVTTMKSALQSDTANWKEKEKNLRRHEIEWHRKIVLSIACLVLFLIGAPLGSIIRKGGLGTPLIFAIIFFMVFYFTTTTGEKFAREGSLSAFGGMWLATFVLVPIGVFLTYKAMNDSQLFNRERYRKAIRNVRSLVDNLIGRK